MRMIESKDGTIKVIELDPSKEYWYAVSNQDTARRLSQAKAPRNGQILVIPPPDRLEIVEMEPYITISGQPMAFNFDTLNKKVDAEREPESE